VIQNQGEKVRQIVGGRNRGENSILRGSSPSARGLSPATYILYPSPIIITYQARLLRFRIHTDSQIVCEDHRMSENPEENAHPNQNLVPKTHVAVFDLKYHKEILIYLHCHNYKKSRGNTCLSNGVSRVIFGLDLREKIRKM